MVGVLPVSHGGTKPVLNPIYSLTLCLDDDSSVHYVLSYLFQAALIRAVYNILLFDLIVGPLFYLISDLGSKIFLA